MLHSACAKIECYKLGLQKCSVPRLLPLASRVFAVSLSFVALASRTVFLLQDPFAALAVAVWLVLVLLCFSFLDRLQVAA
jgi:hypothetical protein